MVLGRVVDVKHEVRADREHRHHRKPDQQRHPQHEAELLRDELGHADASANSTVPRWTGTMNKSEVIIDAT